MGKKVRIATTGMRPPSGIEQGKRLAVALARQAGTAGADLCVLAELYLGEENGKACRRPEVIADLEAALVAVAKANQMYILSSLPHWQDGHMYNAAVLLDRQGRMSTPYFKIHPTEGEIDAGTRPGNKLGVIDFDFGSLGVTICFDIDWPLEWRQLAQKGVPGVIWMAAYDGGFPLQSYAWQHRYWVISSSRGYHGKFIDPTGHVVRQTSQWDRIAMMDVDFGRTVLHIDKNWLKFPAIRERYGARVHIESYSEENYAVIETLDETLSVQDVIAAFDLETFEQYIGRVTDIQARCR